MLTIITPTMGRPLAIIKRCIASVQAQTRKDWQHWIVSDGQHEPEVERFSFNQPNTCYMHFNEVQGHYGAGVRAGILPKVQTPFVCFLDDDNILVSRYVEIMLGALETDPDVAFAICEILHMGPLPEKLGEAPKILTGVPPVYQNIDTLQIVVRTEAIREVGWTLDGYTSDGVTYEKLGKAFPWVVVPEVLGIHL